MKLHALFAQRHHAKWIASFATFVAFAISAAAFFTALHFQNPHNLIPTAAANDEIYHVVIVGKRMTAEEKQNYDLTPEQFAREELSEKHS